MKNTATRPGQGITRGGGFVTCPEGHTTVNGYDRTDKRGRVVAVTWVCLTCRKKHTVDSRTIVEQAIADRQLMETTHRPARPQVPATLPAVPVQTELPL